MNPLSHPPAMDIMVIGDTPDALEAVLRDGVAIAIWARPPLPDVGRALHRLAHGDAFDIVAEGMIEHVVATTLARLPQPVPTALADDIAALAQRFDAIGATGGAVRVRLRRITGPACRRWHTDVVRLRLLCTYMGAPTQWLPLPGGALAARRLEDGSLPCAPRAVPRGAVAVMKGEGFAPGRGCIHRSPPAASADDPRLLLSFDEPGRFPPP
jgi:hypothetical protein